MTYQECIELLKCDKRPSVLSDELADMAHDFAIQALEGIIEAKVKEVDKINGYWLSDLDIAEIKGYGKCLTDIEKHIEELN